MKDEVRKQLELLSSAVKNAFGIEHNPQSFLGQLRLRRIARRLAKNPEDHYTVTVLEHLNAIDLDQEPTLGIIPGIPVAVRTDIRIPDHLNYFLPGHTYVKSGPEPKK